MTFSQHLMCGRNYKKPECSPATGFVLCDPSTIKTIADNFATLVFLRVWFGVRRAGSRFGMGRMRKGLDREVCGGEGEREIRRARSYNERVINCVFMYSRGIVSAAVASRLFSHRRRGGSVQKRRPLHVSYLGEFCRPRTPSPPLQPSDDPKPPPLAYQNYNIYPFLRKLQIINTPKTISVPLHTHTHTYTYTLVTLYIYICSNAYTPTAH